MSRLLSTVGWGVFCASSWTWCIGMFLPVILIDRYGWAGFIAFAVPNVLGCAAFGYVLRSGAHSQRLVRDHRWAMRLFSLVTLAYHVFFLGFIAWVLTPVSLEHGFRLAVVVPVALLLLSAVLSRIPDQAWLPVAAVTYGISLGAFVWLGPGALAEIPLVKGPMLAGAGGLIWLIPAMLFGFLLCPYLDLTFHRALRSSPSRHAFAVFGVTFTVMIILTAAYWDAAATGLSWIVLAHIAAQSLLTMAAHHRELWALPGKSRRSIAALILPLFALPLAFLGALHVDAVEASIDIYLRFLVFYGLVFPAYVLLLMAPAAALRGFGVLAFVVLLLPAAALYELGFIGGLTFLASLPPAGFVLWWGVRRSRSGRGRMPV